MIDSTCMHTRRSLLNYAPRPLSMCTRMRASRRVYQTRGPRARTTCSCTHVTVLVPPGPNNPRNAQIGLSNPLSYIISTPSARLRLIRHSKEDAEWSQTLVCSCDDLHRPRVLYAS